MLHLFIFIPYCFFFFYINFLNFFFVITISFNFFCHTTSSQSLQGLAAAAALVLLLAIVAKVLPTVPTLASHSLHSFSSYMSVRRFSCFLFVVIVFYCRSSLLPFYYFVAFCFLLSAFLSPFCPFSLTPTFVFTASLCLSHSLSLLFSLVFFYFSLTAL